MIQHNHSMPNGLEVLGGFITNLNSNMKYEAGIAMESDNYVMVHGRYMDWEGKNMIAVDIFRLDNSKVVEHWDVMQEEINAEDSINRNAMFPLM